MLTSEAALEVMAYIGVFVLIFGVIASCSWTIPSTIRDMRSCSKNTVERTLFRWDLYLALASLTKLLLLAEVVLIIILTEPSLTRSALTRLPLLVVLSLVAFSAVLTPLRRRAIEKTAAKHRLDE